MTTGVMSRATEEGPLTIAIDWSGAKSGSRRKIWLAAVRAGALERLECGRSRDEVVEELGNLARSNRDLVVGLDFAFSFPRWFAEQCELPDAGAIWAHVDTHGERWLAGCELPFWGRPGRRRPDLPEHLRHTERETGSGGVAKSVFQIGGAGAVGTGSVRGMPYLPKLRAAGFAIWPFDAVALPLVIEIYPRRLTGPVVKSSAEARRAYLEREFSGLHPDLMARAASSEDAFDAAVSALVMDRHRTEIVGLRDPGNDECRIEGAIWAPVCP